MCVLFERWPSLAGVEGCGNGWRAIQRSWHWSMCLTGSSALRWGPPLDFENQMNINAHVGLMSDVCVYREPAMKQTLERIYID